MEYLAATCPGMRLEMLSLSGVENKRKASIVSDDGAKISKILVKNMENFFQNFSRVGSLTAD